MERPLRITTLCLLMMSCTLFGCQKDQAPTSKNPPSHTASLKHSYIRQIKSSPSFLAKYTLSKGWRTQSFALTAAKDGRFQVELREFGQQLSLQRFALRAGQTITLEYAINKQPKSRTLQVVRWTPTAKSKHVYTLADTAPKQPRTAYNESGPKSSILSKTKKTFYYWAWMYKGGGIPYNDFKRGCFTIITGGAKKICRTQAWQGGKAVRWEQLRDVNFVSLSIQQE